MVVIFVRGRALAVAQQQDPAGQDYGQDNEQGPHPIEEGRMVVGKFREENADA
jgi:hypothetical protein